LKLPVFFQVAFAGHAHYYSLELDVAHRALSEVVNGERLTVAIKRILMEDVMDDEAACFTDLASVMLQTAAHSVREAVYCPFRKTSLTLQAARRHYGNIVRDMQDYFISKTVFDLEYQYRNSLEEGAR
jgi:hypothetical protein